MTTDAIQIVSQAIRNQALEAVEAGTPVKNVAEQFNVSESSIRRWMKAAGKAVPATAEAPVVEKPAAEPTKEAAPATPKAEKPAKESTVLDVNREVEYRTGKKIFRKRILLKGNRFKVAQMVKEAIPADLLKKGSDIEKVKELEKPLIEKVEKEIFPGNKGLAANYVHMAVDEMRDGVPY